MQGLSSLICLEAALLDFTQLQVHRTTQMTRLSEGLPPDYFSTDEKRNLRSPKEKVDRMKFFEITLLYVFCLFFGVFSILTNIGTSLWSLFAKPKTLKGKVCLVTGAGRGLGRELCLALAREGAVVACADVDTANNEVTSALVKELGSPVKAYTMNVAARKEVETMIAQAEKELGPIYLLINNAAIVLPMYESTEEYVRACFNVNVMGSMWTTEAVLPRMVADNEGHIVYISSVTVYGGFFAQTAYPPSKAALSSYANNVRHRLIATIPKNKVQITVVHPSFINTSQDYMDLFQSRFHLTNEASDVAADILEAIKFNKEDITSPGYLRALFLLCLLLVPCWLQVKLFSVIFTEVQYPSADDFQKFPVGDLVNSCSSIGLPEKKSS